MNTFFIILFSCLACVCHSAGSDFWEYEAKHPVDNFKSIATNAFDLERALIQAGVSRQDYQNKFPPIEWTNGDIAAVVVEYKNDFIQKHTDSNNTDSPIRYEEGKILIFFSSLVPPTEDIEAVFVVELDGKRTKVGDQLFCFNQTLPNFFSPAADQARRSIPVTIPSSVNVHANVAQEGGRP